MASSVGADFLTRRDPGLFCLYASCEKSKVEQVRKALESEIERLRNEPVPSEELELAKRLLLGLYAADNETFLDQAGTFGFYETLYSLQLAFSYPEEVSALTPEDLLRFARRYFDLSRKVVVTVLPKGGGGG